MGEKVLFLGLKNGGNRVLFSNLASGGAAVAPPPLPGLAPPPLCERQAAPARAPGLPRGLLTSLRGKKKKNPSSPYGPVLDRAGANRETGLGETLPARLSPLPGRPGARKARPGPRRAQPGMAARLLSRPGPRPAAHPGSLQTWLPALHNPLLRPSPPATRIHAPLGRTQAGEELKVCLPPPHRLPRTAAGARGRQRVNPRALAPPSAPARLPLPSPRVAPFPAPWPMNPRPGPRRWPPLHASHRRERVPERGSAYSCRGSVPQLQVDPPLHVHVSLFPPLQT